MLGIRHRIIKGDNLLRVEYRGGGLLVIGECLPLLHQIQPLRFVECLLDLCGQLVILAVIPEIVV